MMSIELLSLLGGGLAGFIFRYLAQKSQDQKELFDRMITANKQTTDNQDKAILRVPYDAGKFVRQVIVLTVLFGTLVAPFILPFFGVPTFVEVQTVNPSSLFGMIPEYSKTFFVELNGFLYTSENRTVLVSIVGFYFGSAAAGNKT